MEKTVKYSVFYRTYQGDFNWLKYSLESIRKYLHDYSEIVIVVPSGDYTLLKEQMKGWGLPKGIVVYHDVIPRMPDDYMGQQACKLKAYEYASFPVILFMDSDVIFKSPACIDDFMKDGKPCILKTPYSEMEGTAGHSWKAITEKALGMPVQFEYMRRLPLVYTRHTLKNLSLYFIEIHGITIHDYIKGITDRKFSEFNLIGAYAESQKREVREYYFLDTSKESLPQLPCKQYWSWSKMTPEEESEIKSFINETN